MSGSFIDQTERSNEELKSEGRIERKRQWGSKVKGSSILKNITSPAFGRIMLISSIHRWAESDYLSLS